MILFTSLHPLAAAVYFASVLTVVMFSAHPVLLLIALLSGFLFSMQSAPHLHFFREFRFFLLLFLLVALTNPLFSHNGVTPLFFLNGNPITLESLLYGVNLGIMLLAVILWFQCFNRILTEDKILYLFGKFSPKLAQILSSVLRFIPLLKTQAEKIRQAQTSMGLFATENWMDRLRGVARVYSSLTTWALENAIESGSSMKSRGYGLRGRSNYSLFRFRRTDAIFLLFTLSLDVVLFAVLASGQLDFTFYPTLSSLQLSPAASTASICFAVLCFLPSALEGKEVLQWKYLRSKI